MILTSSSTTCLPTRSTVQELFSVAREANIIPDLSLDPVLTAFLSLDSADALQHRYDFLRRSMSSEQQGNFSRTLTRELGGPRVTHGGVGIVALALSLLFDHIAQQVREATDGLETPRRPRHRKIFGILGSSRIGRIVQNYLLLIPTVANNEDKMAETTEMYDTALKLELIDHYERMTTKKRMGTAALQQWQTGAALHLHMRIHQVRLNSVPLGSAEALRLSYRTGYGHLVQRYTSYLRKTTKETPAQRLPKERAGSDAGQRLTRDSLRRVYVTDPTDQLLNLSSDTLNETRFTRGHGNQSNDPASRGNRDTLGDFTSGDTETRVLGVVAIEPGRNVSHTVQHRPCESAIIEQALVSRVINSQDLDFFLNQEKIFHGLLRQSDHFEIKAN